LEECVQEIPMLQTTKRFARVGDDGILRIELPLDVTNTEVEYVVVYHAETPQKQQADWQDLVHRTYGALAEDILIAEAEEV
jgi:hypothetical protein